MHDLDEYKFFRQRYPRRSRTESALVVVTDAAIRRWCGPKWRIAASRRTRARATIAEVTMRHADGLVNDSVVGRTKIHEVVEMPDAGSVTVYKGGVHSDKYGTLDFQTPIAEMDMRFASEEEIRLYNSWRTQYERRWQRNFDPIALELTLSGDSIHADLSVIPLMLRSEYRQYTQLVGNARIKPGTNDPHAESLADFTIALDLNSSMMGIARMVIANGATEIDLLEWIDGSATAYFDYDEQWIKRFDNRSPWDLSPDDLLRDVPVGFFIPSKDNLRMTAFVIAVRSTLERFASNMFRWENVKYNGFQYAVGTVIQRNALGNPDGMPQLYYVTTSEGLTLSANRRVIERTIDRHLVNQEPIPQQPPVADPIAQSESEHQSAPQLTMQATGRGIEIMTRTNYRSGLRRMNQIAWSNLPILNYFRQRYPDRDPKAVYEKLFGESLQEPSGGEYVWDEELRTYVSTQHGYHLEPKAGPTIHPILKPKDRVKTTISFQDGGLRATLDVIPQ